MGFIDEASPQTTSNTVRKWSPEKPRRVLNSSKIKANAMGFYPMNGEPAIAFPGSSKIAGFCGFLDEVRAANGDRPIVAILDNFSTHRSAAVAAHAASAGVRLVFLPPYSPDLNPIEFVWKSMKRVVSKARVRDGAHMASLLGEAFLREAAKDSYFGYWAELYHEELVNIVR